MTKNTWGKNLGRNLNIPFFFPKAACYKCFKVNKMKWLYNICILKAKKVVLLYAVQWHFVEVLL